MSETQVHPTGSRQITSSTYANIAVHVEPQLSASHRTEVAARLARDFNAHLIGLGAEAMDAAFLADPYSGLLMVEWITAAQKQFALHLKAAEERFRRDAAGVDFEWRTSQAYPSAALLEVSRVADLIVASAMAKDASNDRTASAADVVLGSGRPVLIVPDAGRHLRATNIVVAWKDTREARRALADALPFLQRAEHVVVQSVCRDGAVEFATFQVNDVVASLKRRGIAARPGVTTARDEDVVAELELIADLNDADLIVAGGYGHSKLAEWAFGSVTDELLHAPKRFVLMSH